MSKFYLWDIYGTKVFPQTLKIVYNRIKIKHDNRLCLYKESDDYTLTSYKEVALNFPPL